MNVKTINQNQNVKEIKYHLYKKTLTIQNKDFKNCMINTIMLNKRMINYNVNYI